MRKAKKPLCLLCGSPRRISSWFCPRCASLIAAAPELLVACKEIVSDKTTTNCLAATGLLAKVEAAIEAAEKD